MYIVSTLVKETIPNYLAGLPIPDSFGGWFRLGVRDWLALLPPTIAVGGISYYSYQTYKKAQLAGTGQVNTTIRKDQPKVVDFIDIEDITEKAVLCRCWKSKNSSFRRVSFFGVDPLVQLNHRTEGDSSVQGGSAAPAGRLSKVLVIGIPIPSALWPYCDGAHGPHNKATGDNTGPVVVKHKAPASN